MPMNNRPIQVGDKVAVVSGPHEGRGGFVTQLRDIQIGFNDPEPYAVIQFPVDGGSDHISVPARRCELK